MNTHVHAAGRWLPRLAALGFALALLGACGGQDSAPAATAGIPTLCPSDAPCPADTVMKCSQANPCVCVCQTVTPTLSPTASPSLTPTLPTQPPPTCISTPICPPCLNPICEPFDCPRSCFCEGPTPAPTCTPGPVCEAPSRLVCDVTCSVGFEHCTPCRCVIDSPFVTPTPTPTPEPVCSPTPQLSCSPYDLYTCAPDQDGCLRCDCCNFEDVGGCCEYRDQGQPRCFDLVHGSDSSYCRYTLFGQVSSGCPFSVSCNSASGQCERP